ncbi:RNA polymerase sigma factor (sigma-70 family) [Pseudomonas protegens]|jgi:RNA polymerase sigma-70 factor (ECF subfamily)|uniref:Sigma-70 family RNA polymerase sigma factor n=1 Tax=Pseudomonas sp. W17 TaxID=3144407 RepID=A0AAU7WLE1_9PSED|nr:sigma-70 family RNA polymerase sigma factor [Pseudomonas protegens]MBF0641825.1 sigma-70 family RNA polymerase sigma factor [Pseudomonas protegens]MCD9568790.1 sigma-70 family RNA polymerase sigma factor [Pseudomonas protegens]MDS9878470.1 sigma-70 family RNA polymerase sigma factor [Pseudomonas protegens]NMZ31428.1 sigma-70 family RNA polymerase sigma factor [Pseudomonas protegens]NMZ88959.1 sigma-70 family RNA polymerase sigma factor [Pseudomonas protegens]
MPAPAQASDLTQLYRQQHQWLKNWLRLRLNCSHSAADLAQDTFLRLLAKPEPVQIQAPRSFLAKVAQSVLSNHYRRQKLERAYLEALQYVPAHVVPDLETQAILLETLMQLDAVLERQEPAVRQAFLWWQLEGLGHEQIAERLQVSVTTVKRYIIKAGAQCILLDDSLGSL